MEYSKGQVQITTTQCQKLEVVLQFHLLVVQVLLDLILIANIPVGGVIVSVSSTDGFGYQPLVSAGGTVIVSSAGTISNITIGNTGSGYRVGLQTVNVAIQTASNLDAQSYLDRSSFIGIGTAQIVDGNITGIAITNPGIIYIQHY